MRDPLTALLGEWINDLNVYSIILRIVISVAISAVLGCERATKRHSAGLRTFILISLSSTIAMIMDLSLASNSNHLMLLSSSAIVAVSIISVRTLLVSSRSQIRGLTTATALWTNCFLGLSIGSGLYTITLACFVIVLFCLSVLPAMETYLKNRSNHFEIHLELKDSHYLENFVTTIRRLGLRIDDIEKNLAYSNSGLSVYSISLSIESKELKKYKTHKEIIEALKSLDYISHIEEMGQ